MNECGAAEFSQRKIPRAENEENLHQAYSAFLIVPALDLAILSALELKSQIQSVRWQINTDNFLMSFSTVSTSLDPNPKDPNANKQFVILI